MGSYYAGMMNATGGSYLRHHGILGMHWYIRRFQNPDGSLTPAGRERYYGKSEQLSMSAKANVLSVSKLTKLPQVKDAAIQVKDKAEKFYKLNSEEEIAAEKAINDFYKDLSPKERQKYIGMPLDYGEDVFGESGEAEFIKYSDHPSARKYRDIHNKTADAYNDFRKSIKDVSSNIVSDAASKSAINKIQNAIEYAAEDMYMKLNTNKELWIKFQTPTSRRNTLLDYEIEIPKYKESESIPKTGMNPNSISQRIGNWYKGRTTGETDSTKVSDRMLRWQMERNIYQNTQLQKNWDFSGRSAREERDLSKKFIKTANEILDNGSKISGDLWSNGDHEGYYKAEAKRRNDAKQAANNYIREVAKIRLKSMGYDVTNKAIDNLISKDWFRNSLWIQNTLASLGADGVNHTSKDDMMFR